MAASLELFLLLAWLSARFDPPKMREFLPRRMTTFQKQRRVRLPLAACPEKICWPGWNKTRSATLYLSSAS
jgi:hypothetical protein